MLKKLSSLEILDFRMHPPASPERLAMAGGDFRFKNSRSPGKECVHLNLQSAIINRTIIFTRSVTQFTHVIFESFFFLTRISGLT
jgi:hypothetical protein